MTVIDQVECGEIAVRNKAKSQKGSRPSRVTARGRLESLGIGNGSSRESLNPHLVEDAVTLSESARQFRYRGICDIQLGKSREFQDSENVCPAGGIQTERAKSVTQESRSQSNENMRHFHTYAISLVSVLIFSGWMFGFFILR